MEVERPKVTVTYTRGSEVDSERARARERVYTCRGCVCVWLYAAYGREMKRGRATVCSRGRVTDTDTFDYGYTACWHYCDY